MGKYTTVDEFIDGLVKAQKDQVIKLRTIIKNAHPELTEHIKWNSPSYMLDGEDRITFSVRPGHPAAIVLHMGATRPEDKNAKPVLNDPFGLITWKSDTRGVIVFNNIDDIEAKRHQFVSIIGRWLKT